VETVSSAREECGCIRYRPVQHPGEEVGPALGQRGVLSRWLRSPPGATVNLMRHETTDATHRDDVTNALRDWLTLVSRAFVVTASATAAVAVVVFAIAIVTRLLT